MLLSCLIYRNCGLLHNRNKYFKLQAFFGIGNITYIIIKKENQNNIGTTRELGRDFICNETLFNFMSGLKLTIN
jgi:hypothetical protein